MYFAGLVVIARGLHPIPSRTRPLNPSAPMVLCLKAWKSRSLPGLPSTQNSEPFFATSFPRQPTHQSSFVSGSRAPARNAFGAGWSSPVARQAHNLKVAGSNPAPATNIKKSRSFHAAAFLFVVRHPASMVPQRLMNGLLLIGIKVSTSLR